MIKQYKLVFQRVEKHLRFFSTKNSDTNLENLSLDYRVCSWCLKILRSWSKVLLIWS